MSWAVGWSPTWYRDIGYGVPATCDQPGCGARIDRGLAYVCGAEPEGGEEGCGLFFCTAHQIGGDQKCNRCDAAEDPHEPTPDVAEWLRHKLTDPSWAEWRATYPVRTENARKALEGAS